MTDKFEKLTFMTALFECMTKTFKVPWLIEKRDYEKAQHAKLVANARNTRELAQLKSLYNKQETEHFAAIRRAEKYNSEVINLITDTNEHETVMNVIDKSIDLYVDFTNLIFENTQNVSKQNTINLVACLLIEHEDGNVSDKTGKRYMAKFLTE